MDLQPLRWMQVKGVCVRGPAIRDERRKTSLGRPEVPPQRQTATEKKEYGSGRKWWRWLSYCARERPRRI